MGARNQYAVEDLPEHEIAMVVDVKTSHWVKAFYGKDRAKQAREWCARRQRRDEGTRVSYCEECCWRVDEHVARIYQLENELAELRSIADTLIEIIAILGENF